MARHRLAFTRSPTTVMLASGQPIAWRHHHWIEEWKNGAPMEDAMPASSVYVPNLWLVGS